MSRTPRAAALAVPSARALGRGESAAEAGAITDRVSGGAALAIAEDGLFVCVTLRAPGRGLLAPIELRAESCAVTGGG